MRDLKDDALELGECRWPGWRGGCFENCEDFGGYRFFSAKTCPAKVSPRFYIHFAMDRAAGIVDKMPVQHLQPLDESR